MTTKEESMGFGKWFQDNDEEQLKQELGLEKFEEINVAIDTFVKQSIVIFPVLNDVKVVSGTLKLKLIIDGMNFDLFLAPTLKNKGDGN